LLRESSFARIACQAALFALVLGATGAKANAQAGGLTANQLARKVVMNEVRAESQDHSHWAFRLETKTRHEQSEVYEVVETNEGDLKLPILRDDKPLSANEKRQADRRFRRSVDDPESLRKERKDNAEDSDRSQRLLKMLPDAFEFTYGEKHGDLVELHFTPNPHFHPPSHEAEVFHAMEGNLWVDQAQSRLAELSGRLIHEVKFGWGVLGHLDKGGEFRVKQAEVAPGYWEMVLLYVNMRGKALFFKTIGVQENKLRRDFHQVPDNLTLAQAADILRQQAARISGGAGGKSGD